MQIGHIFHLLGTIGILSMGLILLFSHNIEVIFEDRFKNPKLARIISGFLVILFFFVSLISLIADWSEVDTWGYIFK